VPEPVVPSSDAELRAHVERILTHSYELEREIGRGGMGIVYLARDRRLKRPVAIKLLPPEFSFRQDIKVRFLKEAETAAQLSHPNIVPIYSVDEREGLVFFVMAFVDGENLAAKLHRQGPFEAEEARRVLREVAEALAYAHDRGVVHRDIKPDNILLDPDGRVLVTDFGIARAVTEGGEGGARLTATGMAIGTPAYMSPEQSMGERDIDGRSDLYSLGVVAYQMLSGDLPFNAPSTPAMLVKHLQERPTPIEVHCPHVPADLSRAVMLLLEKDPANRFPSAAALATALETRDVPMLPSADPDDGLHYVRDSRTPPPRGFAGHGVATAGVRVPSREDNSRWEAEPVRRFRGKLAPFISVSAVALVLAIFNLVNLMPLIGIWSVVLAYQYAKLWTDGHDWRDVLREPKDRLFFDVVAEWIDDVKSIFDKDKRAQIRERDRLRAQQRARVGGGESPRELGAPALTSLAGPYAEKAREAARHRDDILRLVDSLPKRDRDQIADVPATANALYQRIEGLALSLAEIDRNMPVGGPDAIVSEIARLEAEANPLDHVRSEERIRRLAQLKRQRRAIGDVRHKREQAVSKLDSCLLALQNMRLDVLRLKTGGQTFQQITLIAEKAMSLAHDVDSALYVNDEMARLGGARSGGASRA
jgi:serine/threonine protein kinase